MPLHEQLIELTAKNLIACRECHTIVDVSMAGSLVKLICPNCRVTLGDWSSPSAAGADITAFVAQGGK
jgi:uncharacterized paraquat-inducible protein A